MSGTQGGSKFRVNSAEALLLAVMFAAGCAHDESLRPDAPLGPGAELLEVTVDASVPLLVVNAPPSIVGGYTVGTASFGPPLTPSGVTGDVILALDPSDAAGASTTDACTSLTNAAEVAGKIALVDRGTCAFVTKVLNAQNAGAIAVIVVENVPALPPAGMGGDGPTVVIPSVRISLADGNLIKNQLATGSVNATLQGPHPDATPVGEDVVVQPVDQTTGEDSPIDLTFETVTASGTTTVTSSGTGTPPPSGFKLGSPPVYYEIATTAQFDGSIEVCINYDPTNFSRPARLRLFHRDATGGWDDVTTSNDPVAGRICGTVTSLSPFALFESLYVLNGFQPPVDNLPVLNAVKAGQAIPVKFSLGGNWGLDIFEPGSPLVRAVSCSAAAPTDLIEQTVTAGETSLSYDAITGAYRYVWKTTKGWTGCRELTLHFKDGQTQTAIFKF